MGNESTGSLVLNGLLIIIIVFAALLLLWLVIAVLSKIMQKVDKNDAGGLVKVKVKSPRLTRLYIMLAVCSIAFVVLLSIGVSLLTVAT